ncbi:MAG: hypothetical protein M0P26_02410 [Bacteroidales bacterium]|nr:hypothetical protein [Bacteroidales bacterium]
MQEKRKQNIFDFIKEHQKEVSPNCLVIKIDHYREKVLLRYPPRPMEQFLHEEGDVLPRFEYELIGTDFPWRNLIPVYGKDSKGKPKVLRWIEGTDTIPGPSLQRFLDSGEERYIPKYKSKAKGGTESLLLHGKYHFGSSSNI